MAGPSLKQVLRYSNGAGQPPLLDTRDLFACNRVIRVLHNNQEYRLQLTRNGKLILVK